MNCNGSSSVDSLDNLNKDTNKISETIGDVVELLKSSNDINSCNMELSDNTFRSSSNTVRPINGHGTVYSNDGFRAGVCDDDEIDDDSQAMLCEKQAEECVNLLRSLSENCTDPPEDLNFSMELGADCLDKDAESTNESDFLQSRQVIEDSSDSDDSVPSKAEDENIEENIEDRVDNIQTNWYHPDANLSDENINGYASPECSPVEEQQQCTSLGNESVNNGVEMRESNISSPSSEIEGGTSSCVDVSNEMETDAVLSSNDATPILEDSNKNKDSPEPKSDDIVDIPHSTLDVSSHKECLIIDTENKQMESESQTTELCVGPETLTDVREAVEDDSTIAQKMNPSETISKNDEQQQEQSVQAETQSTVNNSGDISQVTSSAPCSIPNDSEFQISDVRQTGLDIHGIVTDTSNIIPGVPQIAVSVKAAPDHGKSPKAAKVKPPSDNMRPVGRILHDLGLDIVRQEVYKDLIDIQEAKDSEHRLNETEKGQLVKLTEAHAKLKTKNSPYHVTRKRCAQCRYTCTSRNVLHLHYEYGQYSRDDWHICCLCDFRTRFPSQFIVHMETVHLMTGRQAKKLSVIICPYCPFENKKPEKVELHAAKCMKRFNLGANLQPLPSDCDIAIRYKPASWLQQAQPSNVSSMIGFMRPLGHPGSVGSRPNFMPVSHGPLPSGAAAARLTSPYSIRPQHEQGSKPASPMVSPATQTREKCEICGVITNNRQVLWGHIRGVHKIDMNHANVNDKDPCIACEMCKSRFWTYQGLARHSIQMHKRSISMDVGRGETQPVFTGLRNIRPGPSQAVGQNVFKCHICGVSQPSLNPLNHLSTQHNITLLTMYQERLCYICNRKLRSGPGFEEHMVMEHRDIFANIEVLRTVLQALSSALHLKSDDRQVSRTTGVPSISRPTQNPPQGRYVNSSGSGAGPMPRQQYVMNSLGATHQLRGSPSATHQLRGSSSATHQLRGSPSATHQLRGSSSATHQLRGSPSATHQLRSSSSATYQLRGSPSAAHQLRGGMRAPQQYAAHQTHQLSPPGFHYVRPSSSATRYRSPMIGPGGAVVQKKQKHTVQTPVQPPMTPIKSPDKKTVEEEEKVLNKLYEEYADIGRPISRAMKQKLLTASPGGDTTSVTKGKDDEKLKVKRDLNISPEDNDDKLPAKRQCVGSIIDMKGETEVDTKVDVKEDLTDISLQTVAPIV